MKCVNLLLCVFFLPGIFSIHFQMNCVLTFSMSAQNFINDFKFFEVRTYIDCLILILEYSMVYVFVFVSIINRCVIWIQHQHLMQPPLNQHPLKHHDWRHSKFIDGIQINQMKNLTCRNIKLIWMTVLRWCWMHCWKSKMKSIQRWHFDDRAVRVSVVHAQWILAEQIRWPVSAKSIQIWANHLKSTHYLICMLYVIWYQTWATSTNSTLRFNPGCRES